MRSYSNNSKFLKIKEYANSYNLNGASNLLTSESISENKFFLSWGTIRYIMLEENSINFDKQFDWDISNF